MERRISILIAIFFVLFFQGERLFAQSSALRNVETLMLKGAYSQAARECQKVLTHHHQAKIKSKGHYLLGICLLKEARYDEARKNFNIILGRYPRSKLSDDANLGVADSYFLAGKYNQGRISYERFLQDFPRSALSSIARKHLEECKQGKHYADSYFSVQVGCFTKKTNAEKLRDELIDAGFQAYILKKTSESLYRVRVGKFARRLKAESLEKKLKAEGYTTKVCP